MGVLECWVCVIICMIWDSMVCEFICLDCMIREFEVLIVVLMILLLGCFVIGIGLLVSMVLLMVFVFLSMMLFIGIFLFGWICRWLLMWIWVSGMFVLFLLGVMCLVVLGVKFSSDLMVVDVWE